jgi:hypothetical protein
VNEAENRNVEASSSVSAAGECVERTRSVKERKRCAGVRKGGSEEDVGRASGERQNGKEDGR